MTSVLLEELYRKYKISDLTFGTIHDKLGDVYEDFCIAVLSEILRLLMTLKTAHFVGGFQC